MERDGEAESKRGTERERERERESQRVCVRITTKPQLYTLVRRFDPTCMYIYIYMCVCVCVCLYLVTEKVFGYLFVCCFIRCHIYIYTDG